ncbi:MAG: hypothetical protein C5B51_05020 [Terriglobia bacterium]|nr:MAG: hypothetical protein C5B51_05020 [Terriglobia bacterium]
MSAKACQLCGKPLSRMRVGSDGDFCSREHRNQFRLRKGMDRLQEANKVANLMRRRENPKQMPLALLLSSPVMERRGALGRAFPELHVRTAFPVSRPMLLRGKIPNTNRHLPELFGHSLPAQVRELAPLPFVAGRNGISRTIRRTLIIQTSVTRLRHGSVARVPLPARGAAGNRHECAAALRASRRPSFEVLGIGLESPGPASLGKLRRFRNVARPQTIGASAKAPPEIGFRRPVPQPNFSERRASLQQGLDGGTRLQPLATETADIAVHWQRCAMPIPEHALRFPDFAYGVIANLPAAPPAGGLAATLDITPATWRVSEGSWRAEQRTGSNSLPAVTLHATQSLGTDALAPAAAAPGSDSYRLEELGFAPADTLFDYKPRTLQGHLSAPRAEPQPAAAPLLEEDFNSGLERWTGEKAEWKLDAAGARPAGLALFQPSLDLVDYDFEFLARIEKRGLTFVFRASNLSNYHKVTIGLTESGRFELRRSVVIGGVEDAAVASPLGELLRAGAAFTVKTSARRNDFAISLDGEIVAHWTDGRLPGGGIGFSALRTDRARIYWARLAAASGPNSDAGSKRPPRSIQ